MALHGNWVAVTPAGRVIMAQALSSNFGRDQFARSEARQVVQPVTNSNARTNGV